MWCDPDSTGGPVEYGFGSMRNRLKEIDERFLQSVRHRHRRETKVHDECRARRVRARTPEN